ncbi:hypothetical protein XH98_16295 [Bradyrhizobium sp. CCBAU 51745]|nr:hypothetical protein [Bradyrhizobium sp. CCBAU 45384]MDA9440639.1 hypothetical protein [Bradyrhizobium sp. CCBAU 51745]
MTASTGILRTSAIAATVSGLGRTSVKLSEGAVCLGEYPIDQVPFKGGLGSMAGVKMHQPPCSVMRCLAPIAERVRGSGTVSL